MANQHAVDNADRRRRLLTAVKTAHTAIWFSIEAAVGYLLYAGLTKRSRGVRTAAIVVSAEIAIFLGNGAKCPLTGAAKLLGAESGSVTDLYLPAPVAKSLPVIHIPILALIVYLHRDRLRMLLPTK